VKVALDTNVVLDMLLRREPFAPSALAIFSLVERSQIEASLCATTLTTIDYLLSKSMPVKKSRNIIANLLELFDVCPVNRAVLQSATLSGITDFEDAVLHESARLSSCQAIVTRNGKDFKKATLTILDPAEFLTGRMQ
jgi:predicted nucleic acid-binding protein